jgi:adenine-specific DNA-methyltransferase
MSQKYKKLKTLLQELFQLDQPDLDFGIYRIMHAKAGEVSQFLDKDLLPQVQAAFGQYKTADKAEIEKELAKVIAGIEAAGMDPAQSPKVNDLRARLANDAVDIGALESEVYDHLFSFFRRYYSEGDFLAKRVYKPGVYAIPYEGEEVTLHWANKDQYYIKTSEYLRDYAFRLRPDNDKKPMRVHFRLVDAVEGEHGNVKAAEGKDRVFILMVANDFIAEEVGEQGKELVIRFEYRPATLTDWPDDARASKAKPPSQKDLIAIATRRVLAVADTSLAPWIAELGKPHVTTSGEKADHTRLEAHLKRYTARNTFDYFIHKDLGTFLRRELDFYIKNEVMHLDDVENETAPRVEQYLSKIKVIRRIAGKIIAFLAQLEDFQKKLWLKKKFVTETSWCIRVGCIPEEFYTEIGANDTQREEWVRLFAVDEIKGDAEDKPAKPRKRGKNGPATLPGFDPEPKANPAYSNPLSVPFLKAHPTLVLDTRHFDADFTARLLDAIGDVDGQADGVLFHSENFQALSLIQRSFAGIVKATYLDPPYNTGTDGFPYKDIYRHSSWMSMMSDRLVLVRESLHRTGVAFCSVDENEVRNLSGLLAETFGAENFLTDIVWQGSSKNDQRYFSISHEYMLAALRDKEYLDSTSIRWLERKEGLDEIYDAFRRIQKELPSDYDAQSRALKEWYAGLKPSHPVKAHVHFNRVEKRGIYFPDNISKPAKGYYYDVIHPRTGRPCAKPKGGWRFIESTMKEELAADNIHFGEDETTVPCRKSFLHETEFMSPRTVIYQDGRAATGLLRDLFGAKDVFQNPKDHNVLARLLRLIVGQTEVVLDAFAGSGSTSHAAISLNREDGGRRKFILVEMGDYFDTVLLPRIKKVTFTPEWKDGKPKRLATPEEAERSPRIVKVIRLESYEDALNNLDMRRTQVQDDLLGLAEAQGADGLREQYMLRYMLNVETLGSQSLLNVQAFTDPTAYKLKVKRPGSDESREMNVDLLETFNWLIGLTVRHIAAPQCFNAAFKRDSEGRLCLDGRIKQATDGPCWFRTVTGTTHEGRKTLVIWRKLTGDPEEDNLVLDEWFTKQGYSSKDSEFDLIYVNGGNNLENLKTPDDLWKVRLIEEDFHRLMFEMEGA